MQLVLPVVECAIEYNNQFLIIQRPEGGHAGGLLAFPGGKVEFSDGIDHANIFLEAIKREVLEEVGITLLDPIKFITSSYFQDQSGTHVIDSIFYCKLETTDPTVIPSKKEAPYHAWMSYDAILDHHLAPMWLKSYLTSIMKHKELEAAIQL